jgi:uracil-DNA glycosylase
MSRNQPDDFLRLLKASPSGAVFNPWWQIDEENDIGPHSPAIRRKHLAVYFRERLGKVRLAIIGEALGYRGGHFSGIPMTSERMLLRRQQQILADIKPRRTSKPNVCPNGFSEPTATIVWGALVKIGVVPDEFVLWNAFPWHSFDPHRGLLSNRMPNKSEQLSGRPVLKAFLELFACEQIVALGKIAAAQLKELGVDAHCIRHPASGGAKLFREQIAKFSASQPSYRAFVFRDTRKSQNRARADFGVTNKPRGDKNAAR